jgi:hypothetical protein
VNHEIELLVKTGKNRKINKPNLKHKPRKTQLQDVVKLKPQAQPQSLKTHTTRIYPTKAEKQLLLQWFGTKRWTYNQCVETIKDKKYGLSAAKKSVLRTIHVNNGNFGEDGRHKDKKWVIETDYEIRDGALGDFYKAVSNEKLKLKKNPDYTFAMKYQARRMPSQSILIRKIKYNKSPKYRFLRSLKAHEQLPHKLDHDSRLVLKDNGDMYLCYPVHACK